MSWWSERAARLQSGVRSEEVRIGQDYPPEEVRRAVVHSREDIVLLIGHADAVNIQLRTIKWLLVVIALALAYLAMR